MHGDAPQLTKRQITNRDYWQRWSRVNDRKKYFKANYKQNRLKRLAAVKAKIRHATGLHGPPNPPRNWYVPPGRKKPRTLAEALAAYRASPPKAAGVFQGEAFEEKSW